MHNNPLSFTDPSGHGLRKWVKRTVKKYGRSIVAVVATVVTAGAAAPYFTTAFASGFTAAGITVGTAANIAAGFSVVMGYAAGGYVGGAVGGGIVCGSDCARQGAQAGAWSGGLFAGANIGIGAYNINPNGFGAITARSTAGGLSSEAQGGNFNEAFRLNYLTGTAAWSYEKIVNFGATWRPGGAADTKNRLDMPFPGKNNIGFTTEKLLDPNGSWLDEGRWFSRALNVVPGINAVAGMHDVFQRNLEIAGLTLCGGSGWCGLGMRDLFNVPGMPIAAAMTLPALTDPYMQYGYLTDLERR